MTETAKQYFFRKLQEIENSLSYSTEELKYSNDPLTDSIVQRLAAQNRDWIHGYFECAFFGKTAHHKVRANAIYKNENYDGFLSTYDVGLTIATHFWSACFLRFQTFYKPAMDGQDSNIYENDPFVRSYFDSIVDVFQVWLNTDTIALDDAQETINLYGIEVDSPVVINLSVSLDMFVVAHEIAHHLLGDTGGEYADRDKLVEMMLPHREVPLMFGSETNEHAADILAFFITVGGSIADIYNADREYLEKNIPDSMIGYLGAISLFSCLSDDPYERIDLEYPAANSRFENAASSASVFNILLAGKLSRSDYEGYNLAYANSFKRDVMDFHDLVNRSRIERGYMLNVPSINTE